METKHTPGPWIVTYDGVVKARVNDAHVTVADAIGKEKVRMPNARLIAAAPELLEELQENEKVIVGLMMLLERDSENYAVLTRRLFATRAAIAKATGDA